MPNLRTGSTHPPNQPKAHTPSGPGCSSWNPHPYIMLLVALQIGLRLMFFFHGDGEATVDDVPTFGA